ncbi:hypothetical protein [Streptacidiphilus sp. EB129]|uniref:hypothetical protein n=1 Tax=Streptacidiphilus sp. EB129 TaxID=3156262 RepID=UPI003518B01E
MKLRTTIGTTLAAAASVLALGASPALAAAPAAHAATAATARPAATVHVSFAGGYKTVNGVRYYHFKHYVPGSNTTGQPTLVGWVSPNKTGENIKTYWQVWYHGAWVNVGQPAVATFKLHQNSTFDIFFHGLKAGYTARVGIAYQGDSKNSAAKFTWQYYHVTK